MREIELTRGKVALVDDGDYEWLSARSWHACKSHNVWYAKTAKTTNSYLPCGRRRYRVTSMHREIMGNPLGEIDHVDRDGLNNTRANMRVCSTAQNKANGTAQKRNKLGLKGVYYRCGGYMAKIGFNSKVLHLGTFALPCVAARAYDTRAREFFGEYACLNYPKLPDIDISLHRSKRKWP